MPVLYAKAVGDGFISAPLEVWGARTRNVKTADTPGVRAWLHRRKAVAPPVSCFLGVRAAQQRVLVSSVATSVCRESLFGRVAISGKLTSALVQSLFCLTAQSPPWSALTFTVCENVSSGWCRVIAHGPRALCFVEQVCSGSTACCTSLVPSCRTLRRNICSSLTPSCNCVSLNVS